MIIKGGICLDDCKEIPDEYKEYITIGDNVIIMTGTVLAANGFGFVRDDDGVLHHRPHEFGVTIGDGVWIGNNCTIDRGRWRDTAVGGGTKIDNAAHIAHNAVIGKHCLIHANTNLCGSVNIGDFTEIYPFSNISPGVTIGSRCTIASNSFVNKDVPDGETWGGVPARRITPRASLIRKETKIEIKVQDKVEKKGGGGVSESRYKKQAD